jgi:hypothetical protein
MKNGPKCPKNAQEKNGLDRRTFMKCSAAAAAGLLAAPYARLAWAQGNPLIADVSNIPVPVFTPGNNHHKGVDVLLQTLACAGVYFYQAPSSFPWSDPATGLIARDDIVLIKVNGQWQYRGVTNSDVVRGVIQRVLDHPEGFAGEVVIIENGQRVGSLNCDMGWGPPIAPYAPSPGVAHANAEDESHSFQWLVDNVFSPAQVSGYLLDPIRATPVAAADHATQGYRRLGNVSYPCFDTAQGRRVELADGIWDGSGYNQNLKLLNIPVFKDHGGSGITGALKHMYGVLSTGMVGYNLHYAQIGSATADMHTLVRTPALNIVDCIWVSTQLAGWPESVTHRADRLLAGFDPVALDYYAAKHILYAWDNNSYHDPDTCADIQAFFTQARDRINANGGIRGELSTFDEAEFNVVPADASAVPPAVKLRVWKESGETRLEWEPGTPPYRIWRSESEDFSNPVLVKDCWQQESFIDTATLPDGRPYYYRVE